MKLRNKFLTAIAVCAIGTTPLALAGAATAHPGNGKGHSTTHTSSSSSKAKQWGKLCQGQSKKHADAAAGTKGTPFSQCVTAMAKLAHGTTTSPSKACSTESKKHVTGQQGTPFSDCVAAGAKLLKTEKHT